MKVKKSMFFISIVGLLLAFLFVLVSNTNKVSAATVSPPGTTQTTTVQSPTTPVTNTTTPATTVKKEIAITGLGAADGKLTDTTTGAPVDPSGDLEAWYNYNVDYNWSIPDGIQIEDGDTATFTLPEGVVANGNLSVPIYNSSKVQIGTATIKDGESTGTIIFNDVLSNTDANREGTLHFVSKGTNTGNGTDGSNWMFNKNGWIAGYDENGVPNELTWNVAFNPNEQTLHNVVITDILGPNQEYIPGSLTAIAGSYQNGGFVNNGQALNPTVTVEGNKVIISFPEDVTTAVDIYYRVKVTGTPADGTTTWSNHATMGSSEGTWEANSNTSWGGSGTGNGDQSVGAATLTKTDAVTGYGLKGAEYELTDSTGKVLMSNAATDENGVLSLKDLPYGDYTLKEVVAPEGYQLNTEPIKFTVSAENTALTLTQKDEGQLGAVVLSKLDPDTNAAIAGTTFNLLDKAGNVIKEGLITDGNGKIAVDNLTPGEYQFVETQPAAGYEANATPINFTVTAGETTPVVLDKFNVAVNVEPNTGNVVLTKVDAKVNKLLPGAIFELQDSNGKVLQSGLTTDEKGQIVISNLEAGNYQFVETSAPEGYNIDETPIKFTVTKDITSDVEAEDTETEYPNDENPGGETPGITPPTVTPEILVADHHLVLLTFLDQIHHQRRVINSHKLVMQMVYG